MKTHLAKERAERQTIEETKKAQKKEVEKSESEDKAHSMPFTKKISNGIEDYIAKNRITNPSVLTALREMPEILNDPNVVGKLINSNGYRDAIKQAYKKIKAQVAEASSIIKLTLKEKVAQKVAESAKQLAEENTRITSWEQIDKDVFSKLPQERQDFLKNLSGRRKLEHFGNTNAVVVKDRAYVLDKETGEVVLELRDKVFGGKFDSEGKLVFAKVADADESFFKFPQQAKEAMAKLEKYYKDNNIKHGDIGIVKSSDRDYWQF
jgi:hypothetical protein